MNNMIPSPVRAAVVPEAPDGTGNYPVFLLRGHRLVNCLAAYPTRPEALDYAEQWNARYAALRNDRRRPRQQTLFRMKRPTSKPKADGVAVIPVPERPAVVLPTLIKADDETRQRFLFEA